MKELIRFSLERRFKNKATIIFNIIVFLLIAILSFSDVLLNTFIPSVLSTKVIYTRNIDAELRSYLNSNASEEYAFKILQGNEKECIEEGHLVLKEEYGEYVLYSKYKLEEPMLLTFETLLKTYHQQGLIHTEKDLNFINRYEENIKIKNKVSHENIDMSEEKSSLLFLFMSAGYFMMLSFVSGVVSEVVNEKTTKTLELILTSVSAKMHFFAKLIVGWLVIILQGCASMGYVLIWLFIRLLYDKGAGLVKFINHLHIVTLSQKNFPSLLSHFDFNLSFFVKFFWILLFVLCGILLLQLVMVITSCFVTTIEEASNIQAPFYLVLLVIYYIAIALNTPEQLSEGIGFYMSFIPFVNMLFMPCRLLIQDVPFIELLLSSSLTLCTIYFIIIKGSPIYEEGVLDYSNKGFIEIMKRIYSFHKHK